MLEIIDEDEDLDYGDSRSARKGGSNSKSNSSRTSPRAYTDYPLGSHSSSKGIIPF